MSKTRKEKKSEMIEVRIPHSKKQAFMQACEEEGITASHAIRTFIDAYLKRSRRMKVKQVAQELSMTLIRNPIKTTSTVGTAVLATLAISIFTAAPSAADRDAQPIEPPAPIYPKDMASLSIGAECYGYFDVSKTGYVKDLRVECGHEGFVKSATNAIASLRFEPKMDGDEPVERKGVVYPLVYMMTDSNGIPIQPILKPQKAD